MTQSKTLPYFSIIIPCLNEEKYLPNLLKNLSHQTFKKFEVFVVDGNSDDTTPTIVANYHPKYPLTLVSTSTRNVSYQRNLGAKQANGQVLIFFDADTQIPKHYLEKIHAAFQTKKPHLLTTWMQPDSNVPSEKFLTSAINLFLEAGRIIGSPGSFGAMTAFRKGVFFDIGGYDEKTKWGEDKQIVETAVDQHYVFIILKKPAYTFSMRRFRTEGTLKSLINNLNLGIATLTSGYHLKKVNYPMGGHVFSAQKASHKLPLQFGTIITKLKDANQKQRKSIQKIIDSLFN